MRTPNSRKADTDPATNDGPHEAKARNAVPPRTKPHRGDSRPPRAAVGRPPHITTNQSPTRRHHKPCDRRHKNTVNRSITVSYEATHDAPHPRPTPQCHQHQPRARDISPTTTHPRTSPCAPQSCNHVNKPSNTIWSAEPVPRTPNQIEQITNNHERYWLYRTASPRTPRAHTPLTLHLPPHTTWTTGNSGTGGVRGAKQYNTKTTNQT
jgi:hypothetical protein